MNYEALIVVALVLLLIRFSIAIADTLLTSIIGDTASSSVCMTAFSWKVP